MEVARTDGLRVQPVGGTTAMLQESINQVMDHRAQGRRAVAADIQAHKMQATIILDTFEAGSGCMLDTKDKTPARKGPKP